MDRMLDEMMGLMLGLAILLVFGLVAALIYVAIAVVVYQYRLSAYRKQAEADFEQEAARMGIDLPAEEIIQTVHSVGIDLPADGFDNVGEWVAGSLFGTEQYEEVA